jgi:hypothetical protein
MEMHQNYRQLAGYFCERESKAGGILSDVQEHAIFFIILFLEKIL